MEDDQTGSSRRRVETGRPREHARGIIAELIQKHAKEMGRPATAVVVAEPHSHRDHSTLSAEALQGLLHHADVGAMVQAIASWRDFAEAEQDNSAAEKHAMVHYRDMTFLKSLSQWCSNQIILEKPKLETRNYSTALTTAFCAP